MALLQETVDCLNVCFKLILGVIGHHRLDMSNRVDEYYFDSSFSFLEGFLDGFNEEQNI